MKKILAAACLAVMLLSGCGAEDASPAQTETTQTPAPEPTRDVALSEKAFVSVVLSEYPELDEGDDQTLIDAGYRLCRDVKAGYTLEDFANDALAEGLDPEMYGFVLGAAVQAFCPEEGQIMDEAEQYSGSDA